MVSILDLREVPETEVVDAMVPAFMDDPGWVAVVQRPDHRREILATLFRTALNQWPDDVRVALEADRVVGAASWPAPGTYPPGRWAVLRMSPWWMLTALRTGRVVSQVAAFGAAVDRAFPDEPVRYLQVLGVHPEAQRRGVGSALLADGIERADSLRESIYLETAAEANVPYYIRFGFRVMAGSPSPIGDGLPVMWRMSRPASG